MSLQSRVAWPTLAPMPEPRQSFRSALFLAILSLGLAAAEARAADYERCTALLEEDAARARAYARDWKARDGGDAALHCEALALSALGEVDEAATALGDLAGRMSGAPAAARAEIYAQAGNAWALAANLAKAEAAFDEAVTLAPAAFPYRLGRARVRALRGNWEGVRIDAGEALAESPSSAEALTLRAAALRNLGYPKAALGDAERAVSITPHNLEALIERGRVRAATGNVPGARADWQDVLRFAKATGRSDDPSAQAARDYLKRPGE